MDELESRLNDGLGRHADQLPRYDDNLARVTRRGRNRRWAVRGAGAFGALAILGGGIALYSTATRDGGLGQTATGEAVPLVEPTPVVTPEPTPVVTPEPTPTPEAVATPAVEPVNLTFAIATGWGVGLVGQTGDLYAPIICCTEDSALATNPRTVRDDLRGGILAATDDAIHWVPADDLAAGGQPEVAVSIPEPAGPDVASTLSLWDVAEIQGEVTLLYSVDERTDSGGSSTLYSLALGAPAVDAANGSKLEASQWEAESPGEATAIADAAWLPEGGYMTLESLVAEPCEWISFAGAGADDHTSPYPKPDDLGECPHDSIGAAALNDSGVIAVTHRYLSPTPELAVHDRGGNELFTWPLAAGADEQGPWTEIDMSNDQVIVSRAGDMTDENWATLDETIRIDIAAERGIGVWYFGAPSLPRVDISTTELTPLDPDDPLWFVTPGGLPDPEPEPTPDATPVPVASVTPGPTPTPDPDPTPDATPEPTPVTPPIPPEARIPTGRLVDIKPSGVLVGDDGCLKEICLGQPIEDALGVAEATYGPEDTENPEATLEGEPPAAGEHVFITDTEQVRIVEADGLVAEHRVTPTEAGIDQRLMTIGDVLAAHGAPAVVFNGGGEGIQVLWLFYDTDAVYVAYGFTEYRGDTSRLLPEGDLGLPETYDELPVNSYWSRDLSE